MYTIGQFILLCRSARKFISSMHCIVYAVYTVYMEYVNCRDYTLSLWIHILNRSLVYHNKLHNMLRKGCTKASTLESSHLTRFIQSGYHNLHTCPVGTLYIVDLYK